MSRILKRAITGVLLFDKSLGDSSNQALQRVKRIYRAEKTGHTGTLDPLASGLLPLMFGEATKYASDLIDAVKEYEATVKLGWSSTTGDAEGDLSQDPSGAESNITLDTLREAALSLTGDISQVPPMYSAIKKDGKPLYELARQGIELERSPRIVTIHVFEILELFHQPEGVFASIRVRCSKGTYIRTLAEDLARQAGTSGYLTSLRRTAVGRLRVEEALTLNELEGLSKDDETLLAVLKPVDELLSDLPAIVLQGEMARRFSQGQRLPLEASEQQTGRIRVYVAETEATQEQQDLGRKTTLKKPRFLGTGILKTHGANGLLCPDRLTQERL